MSTSNITVNGTVYRGERIGLGTSYLSRHTHAGEFLPPGQKQPNGRKIRCPACRWQEVSIYAIGQEHYLVHSIGHTTVPGEERYEKSLYTKSVYEVLEFLIVRNRDGAFLNGPCRTALAQAADEDREMERLYRSIVVKML